MNIEPLFAMARKGYHSALLDTVLTLNSAGVPSNADKDNRMSVDVAVGIAKLLKAETQADRLAGQTSGNKFEDACATFVDSTFKELSHIRPGKWQIYKVSNKRNRLAIAEYEQYSHLELLYAATKGNSALAAVLGNDYTITPDIVVARDLESDEELNCKGLLIDNSVSRLASLRKSNGGKSLLHASISCKWTIRSDRAQNARSEALNLIRNRKGQLPHVVVVTAEPTPSRLASLALGTGDIDCVYHFALHEMQETLNNLNYPDAVDMLNVMVDGKRLKDISDLPLDLAV